MDDLINRQAAIDAIDEIESEVEDGDGFQYEKWRQFFCDLPSVELQPTCNKLATSCNQLATDYIRREDAIEVIEKMMEVYWDRKVVLARAWEQIKDLPSADIDLSDYSDRLWRNAYEQGKAVSKDALDEAYAHGYTAAEADFHKKNHEVACIIADLFGDACACNFNDIDEWLPRFCEFANNECPNPGGVACWEQYLTWKGEADG